MTDEEIKTKEEYVNILSVKVADLKVENASYEEESKKIEAEMETLRTRALKVKEEYEVALKTTDEQKALRSTLEGEIKASIDKRGVLTKEIEELKATLEDLRESEEVLEKKVKDLSDSENSLTVSLKKREEIIKTNETTLKDYAEQLDLRQANLTRREALLIAQAKG